MIVRNAMPSDMPEVHRMARNFYATTSYSGFAAYSEADVENLAAMMMDSGVFLVAEHEGRAVGMVALAVTPFMFNAAHQVAYEVIWWVDEDQRGSGAGKALLLAIEPACLEAGVTAIQMVHLANSPEHAGQLYERLGFAHTETSYTKVL